MGVELFRSSCRGPSQAPIRYSQGSFYGTSTNQQAQHNLRGLLYKYWIKVFSGSLKMSRTLEEGWDSSPAAVGGASDGIMGTWAWCNLGSSPPHGGQIQVLSGSLLSGALRQSVPLVEGLQSLALQLPQFFNCVVFTFDN